MAFQFGLQGFISSLESGVGNRILRGFFVLVFATSVIGGFAFRQFRGLKQPAAMEAAQLARSLAAGEGYVTRCLRPADLYVLGARADRGKILGGLPDVRQAPAYPRLLGWVLQLLHPSYTAKTGSSIVAAELKAVLPVGLVCVLLTGWVVWLLGRRLFDSQVGFFAMVGFFVTEPVLAAGMGGTALPLTLLLGSLASLAALVAVQSNMSGRRPWAWRLAACVAGLLAGLAFLSGYSMGVVVLVIGLFMVVGSSREKTAMMGLFVALAVLTVTPWLLRNWQVSGRLLGLAPQLMLRDSTLFDGNLFERACAPGLSLVRFLQTARYEFTQNIGEVFKGSTAQLGGGVVLTSLFVVSYLFSFELHEANRLRWCVGAGVLLMLGLTAITGPAGGPLLLVFLPVAVVFAVAFLFVAMESSGLNDRGWQPIVVWTVIMLTAFPALMRVIWGAPAYAYPPYRAPYVQYVCAMLEPDEAICTDMPWATAWYGNRTSLLLPTSPEAFVELRHAYTNLNALYLTAETGDAAYVSGLQEGAEAPWLPLLNRMIPVEFPLQHGFDLPPGGRAQLMLVDRPRWP